MKTRRDFLKTVGAGVFGMSMIDKIGSNQKEAFAATDSFRYQAKGDETGVKQVAGLKTLIVCGSKYGSTKLIGEWIAERLEHKSVVAHIKDAPSPDDFELVILGAGIYRGQFLPEFNAYVDKHINTLESKKKAVFAVCLNPKGAYVNGKIHGGWQYVMPLAEKFKSPPLHAAVLHGEINPTKLTPEDREALIRYYHGQPVPYKTKLNKEEVWEFAEGILNKLGRSSKGSKA